MPQLLFQVQLVYLEIRTKVYIYMNATNIMTYKSYIYRPPLNAPYKVSLEFVSQLKI